jgi:hypothetical protein
MKGFNLWKEKNHSFCKFARQNSTVFAISWIRDREVD